MKEIFREGDQVELLPYARVKDHLHISNTTWDKMRAQNPLTVCRVEGDCVMVQGATLYFKNTAFTKYAECIAEVGDLV